MVFDFLKGKMEIQVNGFNFKPGQTIEGSVNMKLKKMVHAQGVNIALVGEQTVREMRGGKYQQRTVKVFEFKMPLDGEKDYSGEASYPFKITVPGDILNAARRGGIELLGGLVNIGGSSQGYVKWYLSAELDVKMGFDLDKKIQINIA